MTPSAATDDDRSTDQHALDDFYDALLWISEYPNRETFPEDNADAVALAEYARTALREVENRG